MSSVTELIIGVDMGSTCMTGVLGKRISGGTEILAIKQVPVISGIRRGVIHNLEEVSKGIQELLDGLMTQSGKKCEVNQIYIGINGYSIRTVDVTSTTTLSGDEILNDVHLDALYDEVVEKVPENLDIIDIFPQEFIVDGKIDLNPIGSMPKSVEAHYKVVVGKPTIFRNLNTCFERAHIRYEQVLGPLASAEAVLEAEEKSKGVVVVNFGAETTSVCIYKGNIVRYVSILPFGGSNINTDLLQLNIDEDEAEKLKIERGTVIHYSETNITANNDAELPSMSDFEKEANDIIVARAEEIVENIYAQIRYSGAEIQKLTGGIVITGGASQLTELDNLLCKKTGLPVRKGNPLQNVISNPLGLDVEPGESLAIGLLLLGKADCCSEPEPGFKQQEKPDLTLAQTFGGFEVKDKEEKSVKPTPEPKKKKQKNEEKTGSKLSDLFKGLFDDEDL